MSASYSYPGIYIQELPLSAHTITPAPTSIAAFVGYTHPWKTPSANFGAALQLFSFTDYETNFGGIYTSGIIASDVARAVYEFFLNGGTNCYVVGLQPNAYAITATGLSNLGTFGLGAGMISATAQVVPDSGAPTAGIVFTALEPVDMVPMTITFSNIRYSTPKPATPVYDTFDLTISYGPRIEVFRNVGIGASSGTPLATAVANSALISIAPITSGGSLGTDFSGGSPTTPPPNVTATPALTTLPGSFATSFAAADFLGDGSAPGPFDADSSLDKLEIFNLLLVPGVADNSVVSAALAFAERKLAFAILDPPQQAPAAGAGAIDTLMTTFPQSQNGALYFPYLVTTDVVTSNKIAMPPSGYVAGIYAATDTSRGVWKAPAGIGTPLKDTVGPVATGVMNDMRQGVLNLASVNCIRTFASTGTVVFGSRTLVAANTAFAQSKYVPVRRMTLFIEQTLLANLKWVVFEPNDEPLWIAIRLSIESFLLSLFNQQALQGSTPSQAFQVKCDKTTTTPDDQANGIVNIVVGVALLKPAEFVVIKIAQIAGQTAGS